MPNAALGLLALETPPRAWGRRATLNGKGGAHGNTPTGVGKTDTALALKHKMEKHPHGRGEDRRSAPVRERLLETPPRAWGRRGMNQKIKREKRNTPTGVGKTRRSRGRAGRREKHPHGRGEDRVMASLSCFAMETPPRAWGRQK